LNMAGSSVTLPVDLPVVLETAGVARKTYQLQKYGEFKKAKIRFVEDGLDEQCNLHNFALFCRVKPWRRE